jgi:hypothetical protein
MFNEFHIAELIAEITAAFEGVAREDGTTLHEAIAIDNGEPRERQLAARRLDTERRWQDLSGDSILSSCTVPCFLDAQGFRYYLPAFLVYGLSNWNTLTSSLLDTCEYCLLHESGKSLRQSEPESIAAKYDFTEAQCRAVAHFLRFHVGVDDEFTSQDRPTLEAVAKWEYFVGNRVSLK